MVIRLLSIFALCLAVSTAQAAVYKWMDPDGNIHYGDTPPPAGPAEPLRLPENSTFAPRQLPSPQTQVKGAAVEAVEKPSNYPVVRIVAPENAGTVRSNEGIVDIQVELQPALAAGHVLACTLDGVPIAEKVAGEAIRLTGVDRGTHTVVATVQDETGKELGRSAAVTFTLRKTSLLEGASAPGEPNPEKYTKTKAQLEKEAAARAASEKAQRIADEQAAKAAEEARQMQLEERIEQAETGVEQGPLPVETRDPPVLFDPNYTPPAADYTPNGRAISTTPGQTNPFFAPNYTP